MRGGLVFWMRGSDGGGDGDGGGGALVSVGEQCL